MSIAAQVWIGVVAVLHAYFCVLETFLWTKPAGRKAFRMSVEQAQATAVLAANQGLYNAFLSAGLAWSLFHPNASMGRQLAEFFLGCVVVAGAYGAYSVSKRVFFIQALPALIGLACVWMFTSAF